MKKQILASIIFIFLTTIVSSYTFWWNAVYRMQVVASGSAYNTGRMYCETPIHVLLDNPTTGAGSYQINIYFSWGTQVDPIASWYAVFERSPFSNVWVYPSSPNITGGNLLTYGFHTANAWIGTAWVVATFRVKSLPWITSTQLVFSSTPNSNSVAAFVGGTELLWSTVPLTINFATWPCMRDINGPIITMQTVVNWAYRVNTGNDLNFLYYDRQNIGKHYRYVTTTYSDVSPGNYVVDTTTTWDNQYGVNSGSIHIKMWWINFHAWSMGYSALATGTTWDLHDRWYTVTIDKNSLPVFPTETAIILIATGNDNLGNNSVNGITFNFPRSPFVYRTGVANRNWGLSSISAPYTERSPNTSTLVYPKLNLIKFMVLDDRAGVKSGSLSVTIRSGSIAWPILRSGGYNDLSLTSSWFTYASNGLAWSNAITHSFNYALSIYAGTTNGFDLPYNTDIYVVVGGSDLVNNAFVQTGFANDQNNYFKFTTRNSCMAMQCIDRVILNTGDINSQLTFSWAQLTVSWWTNPYLSWDTLYCNMPSGGIDLQTWWITFETWYLLNMLTIKDGTWYTTYLSWDTVYVKKYACGDGILQTPNFSGNNEQCDDGNNVNGDGCSASCQRETPNCNDFIISANPTLGYVWWTIIFSWNIRTGFVYHLLNFADWSNYTVNSWAFMYTYAYTSWGNFSPTITITNSWNTALSGTCTFAPITVTRCWDGIVNWTEQCDDGNTSNNDGCNSSCHAESVPSCNNFNLQASPLIIYSWQTVTYSWTTPLGYRYQNLNFGDWISVNISWSAFNTGHTYISWWTYVWQAIIQNIYSGSIISQCNFTGVTMAICGDSIVQGNEQCDDGSSNGTTGYCNATCSGFIPTITIGWGIWWWGWKLTMDDCKLPSDLPWANDGWIDNSSSYYDGTCEGGTHNMIKYCGIGETQYSTEIVDAFQYAYGLWITSMCPIERARLDGYVLRKELAKMISEFAIQVIWLYPEINKKECEVYNDIWRESDEMKFYMKLSCKLWLMGLNENGIVPKKSFDPNQYIDRAQFGTIMSRLIFGGRYNVTGNVVDHTNKDYRFKNHLAALKANAIMNNISDPYMLELRWYIMIMMQRTDESGIVSRMRPRTAFINGFRSLVTIDSYWGN